MYTPEQSVQKEMVLMLLLDIELTTPPPKISLAQREVIEEFKSFVTEHYRELEGETTICKPLVAKLANVGLLDLASLLANATVYQTDDTRAKLWQMIRYTVEVRLDAGYINIPVIRTSVGL